MTFSRRRCPGRDDRGCHRPEAAAALRLALTLTLVGCATSEGARGEPEAPAGSIGEAREYLPLAVGNRWRYRADFLGQEGERSIEIVAREGRDFVDQLGSRYRVAPDGVNDGRRFLIKDPLTVGAGWRNTVSISAVERYRIVEAGLECSVPAGSYPSCVTVESRIRNPKGGELINRVTFARGVGIVRVRTYLEKDEQRLPQVNMELLELELLPPVREEAPGPAVDGAVGGES